MHFVHRSAFGEWNELKMASITVRAFLFFYFARDKLLIQLNFG